MKKSVAIGFFVFLILVIVVLNYGQQNREIKNVLEVEKMTEVTEFQYGADKNQVGFKVGNGEGDVTQGATSFFVRDKKFYVLDNVNKKIVIKFPDESYKEIHLEQSGQYEDLYVLPNNSIYVLDSSNRKLLLLNEKGEQEKEYPIVDALEFPKKIEVDSKGQVYILDTASVRSVAIDSSLEFLDRTFLESTPEKISRKVISEEEVEITVGNDTFTVQFEHSNGGLEVLSVTDDQVVIVKTEIAKDVTVIMIESFVEVYSRKGEFLGAARIPLEKTDYIGTQFIRVVNEDIFLTVHEKNRLLINKLEPGKTYEKLLQKQIDAFEK